MSVSPAALNAPYTGGIITVTNTASAYPGTYDIILKAENGAYSASDTSVLVISASDSVRWARFTTSNSGLPANRTGPIMKDPLNNDLWISSYGTTSFLSRFNGYSWENIDLTYHAANNDVVTDMCGNPISDTTVTLGVSGSFYIDSNRIWTAGAPEITYFDRISKAYVDTLSFSSSIFKDFAKTADGNLWLTGYYSQLWKYNGRYWSHLYSANSPLPGGDFVSAIAAGKHTNTLWIGTSSSGLLSFDGIFWNTYNTVNSGIPWNNVTGITLDDNDLPIVCADNGIYRFDGSSFHVINTNRTLVALQVDSSTIWYSDANGLHSYNGISNTLVYATNEGIPVIDFSADHALYMTKDNSGNIWLGTLQAGLVLYNKDGLHDFYNAPHTLLTPVLASVQEQRRKTDHSLFTYPNPSNGQIRLAMTLDKPETLSFWLMDARGVLIRSWEATAAEGFQELSFDISSCAAGMYYLNVSSDSFVRSQKLIITK